jgi:hypothetical protein
VQDVVVKDEDALRGENLEILLMLQEMANLVGAQPRSVTEQCLVHLEIVGHGRSPSWGDSVENIADAIVVNVTPGTAESIARGILQRLKKAKPAG